MGRISGLLTLACRDVHRQSGLKTILTLERGNNCSCSANKVRGWDEPPPDINAAPQMLIRKLNAAQVKLGTTPQCEINATLCGKE